MIINKRPIWNLQLHFIKSEYNSFLYFDSQWANWESRIKTVHASIENDISNKIKQLEIQSNNDWEEFQYLDDEHFIENKITRSMHASLIVGIFADIENKLNHLSRIGQLAKGIAKEKIKKNHNFNGLVKAIKTKLSIDIKEDCSFYDGINDIRILNNCFKHNEGVYNTGGKVFNDFSCGFLNDYNVNEGDEIKYEELSFQKIVKVKCDFMLWLIESIESKVIKNKVNSI